MSKAFFGKMKIKRDYLTSLLCEKVIGICKDRLHYKRELKVQGLLGITLDDGEVILVSLDTTVFSSVDCQLLSALPISSDNSTAVIQPAVSDNSQEKKKKTGDSVCHILENQHSFLMAASDIIAPSNYSTLGEVNAFSTFDVPCAELAGSTFSCVNLSSTKQFSVLSDSESYVGKPDSFIEEISLVPEELVHLIPTRVEPSYVSNINKNTKRE